MTNSAPSVSIITATFNAVEHLPYTIRSLREQTTYDFEWIVVDGNSTDGTQDLLRENEDVVTRWIGEPDQGIYDAWNKACKIARGEWFLFLGAGDELAEADTLEKCIHKLKTIKANTTLAYGIHTLLSPIKRIPLEKIGVSWKMMEKKWEIGRRALPPHGSTFHRKRLFTNGQHFDLRFPIASDTHLMIQAISLCAPEYMPIEVTKAPMGGISFRLNTARQVGREVSAINSDLGINPPLSVKVHEFLRITVISILNLLPDRAAYYLADFVRRLSGKPARWLFD